MGKRGTQVAQEAAPMVLRDDRFATIISAMRQGRVIFDNIRKFVVYLMSCNVSEVLVVGLAVGAGLPMPLLPLQILFLNLVTDVFPAFALGLGKGDGEVMRKPPRDPKEQILDRARWRLIAVLGALITIATLGAFLLALTWLALTPAAAVTVAFLTLALAQLWNVFNMRDADAGPISNEVARHPYVVGRACALPRADRPCCRAAIAGEPPRPALAGRTGAGAGGRGKPGAAAAGAGVARAGGAWRAVRGD